MAARGGLGPVRGASAWAGLGLGLGLLLLAPGCGGATDQRIEDQAEQLFKSGHTNNWAVLVCTSRFWFNYRHVANTLSVYRSVKRLGIPDSHIVLMLADDMACNPRNPKPATVFSHKNMELNVYGDDVEVDYRSYEVTVENFLRVLTGRVPPSTPRSKRLLSDDRSNILIYMTGHGGNGFLKFQDSEEITNVELADAFEQMWQKRRYHEMLFIIDTCQGASMYERFYSPNVMALASSQVGEDSLSHQPDLAIGVHLMDRYTFYVLEFLEEIHPASQANMNDLFQVCPKSLCVSTPGHRTDLFQRNPQNVLITDFFGSVRKVEITTETVSLKPDLSSLGYSDLKCQKDEELTEPLNYAVQLPVAQIIHQKPKPKEWHPPGGFILGLWALILMVFFKTYGIKHMKYVF
ncbi:GPI-anchor transamidase isoform X2 [Trichosurus vulpecula]|uniref:GPI-anchor transamidase isoform X2 n=1 Tax=Trichosurus vulpecula TaxID=9337 RepID=UPI00186B1FD5|nr:GPI-anchor transamidase isoform X2 [Trichosurus vulpecula]